MSGSRSFAAGALTLSLTWIALSGRGLTGETVSGAEPAADSPAGLLPRFALTPASLFRDEAAAPFVPRPGNHDAPASGSALFDAALGRASFFPGSVSLLPPLLGQGEPVRRKSYLQLRAGPLLFLDDFEDLSPGLDTEIAYGFLPLSFLIFEIYSGYAWAKDEDGSVENRLQVIPIVANAKIAIPIRFLRPYVGAGAGGFYLNTEQDRGSREDEEDDLVLGWNAMVGINFHLGPLLISAEAKYLGTESAEVVGGRAHLEGLALLLGAGFRF